jgi:glycosyltransferase involved in cell wall biosynthesis
VALIYRSPAYAKFFYQSLVRYTPELKEGSADFLFVANSATRATLKVLKKNNIPHVEFQGEVRSEQELLSLGYAAPEYLSRVYEAYNFGVSQSKGDLVLLVNSDMVLSPGWLEKILKHWSGNSIVSTNLVERHHPKYGTFPNAIEKNFGTNPRNFDFDSWEGFCRDNPTGTVSTQTCMPYMPALFKREWFEVFGGYPLGNLGDGIEFSKVLRYGDEAFFDKLAANGIHHIAASNVMCYHFKEGEKATHPLSWFLDIFGPSLIRRTGLIWLFRKIRQRTE